MQLKSIVQRAGHWLVIVLLLGSGLAMAQAEPSLNQVYSTAQAGKLDEAQIMIQQVLVSHPKSAKAHFVRAELFARQGKPDLARESLVTAEKLSPSLSFAKPEAVKALRLQLAGKAVSSPAASYAAPFTPAAPASSSFSWVLPVLLAGGALVGGYFFFRRKAPAPMAQQPGLYVNQGGLSGPQRFGVGGGGAATPAFPQQAAYPPSPVYPSQAGAPQQAGSGLGGRIMGGVATGLAVGAGVMAAQAIGRNLMGNHDAAAVPSSNFSNNDFQPISSNLDMGGADFGVNDASSWDDGASSSDAGGASDWDT